MLLLVPGSTYVLHASCRCCCCCCVGCALQLAEGGCKTAAVAGVAAASWLQHDVMYTRPGAALHILVLGCGAAFAWLVCCCKSCYCCSRNCPAPYWGARDH